LDCVVVVIVGYILSTVNLYFSILASIIY